MVIVAFPLVLAAYGKPTAAEIGAHVLFAAIGAWSVLVVVSFVGLIVEAILYDRDMRAGGFSKPRSARRLMAGIITLGISEFGLWVRRCWNSDDTEQRIAPVLILVLLALGGCGLVAHIIDGL